MRVLNLSCVQDEGIEPVLRVQDGSVEPVLRVQVVGCALSFVPGQGRCPVLGMWGSGPCGCLFLFAGSVVRAVSSLYPLCCPSCFVSLWPQ